MSGFSFDDLDDLDEGANDKPAPGGGAFDSLQDLDASDSQPTYGYDSQDKGALDLPDLPTGKPGTMLDTAKDAVTGLAEGAYRGVGINPAQLFGDRVGMQLQTAHSASPMASRVGELGGEAAIQTLGGRALAPLAGGAKVAPAAAGALSGLLSGVGNSSGSASDRARAGLGGAAAGAVGAHVIGGATGKLSSLLENKGAQWGEEQASHGLMNSGATAADLQGMDAGMGGRQRVYDESKRLGITGKPPQAKVAAQRVIDDTMQRRAALEAAPNIQIDPSQVAARVRGANPYPGVSSLDNAAGKAADDIQNSALEFDRLDGFRDHWGEKTNFASGTPENQLRRNIHGAINDSMDDAMSRANPGAGDEWRQTGKDLNIGMEMRSNASTAADRARGKDWDGADLWTGGLKPLLNNNRHGIAETGYGAAANMANGGAKLGSLLQGAPAALAGDAGGKYGRQSYDAINGEADRETKPLKLDQAALDLLSGTSKGTELGEWRNEIAQAAGSPDAGAVQAAITRLTMSNPEFRIKILPLLRQHAGGQM